MRAKKSSRKPVEKSPSPLDEQKRALAEKEVKLHAEIARRLKLIEQAPLLAEEQQRRRRDELIKRASRTDARHGSRVALQDPRFGYEANLGTPAPMRRLKSERRRGMLTFFVLCAVLAAVLCWLYYTVIRDL